MIPKIKMRIRKSWIWRWGGGTSKNGLNLAAFLILLSFGFYAVDQANGIAEKQASVAEDIAQQALDLSILQADLIYKIQSSDFVNCERSVENIASVKAYNKRVLDFATQEGLDVDPLYIDLETLYILPPPCVEPAKPPVTAIPQTTFTLPKED